MSFLFKSLFYGNLGGWVILFKLSFFLICLGVVSLIVWSKQRKFVCKTCRKQIDLNETQCHNCGSSLTNSNTSIVAGTNTTFKKICILGTATMVCLFTISVVAVTQKISIGNLATGVYSGYHQLYVQNDNIWGVECKSALTDGSFRHIIEPDNIPANISVNSSSDSGTLILNILQNGTTESYEISNTDGEQIDLAWLIPDYEVRLSVEHTLAKNIHFVLDWS